jgi:hypothetical protein
MLSRAAKKPIFVDYFSIPYLQSPPDRPTSALTAARNSVANARREFSRTIFLFSKHK